MSFNQEQLPRLTLPGCSAPTGPRMLGQADASSQHAPTAEPIPNPDRAESLVPQPDRPSAAGHNAATSDNRPTDQRAAATDPSTANGDSPTSQSPAVNSTPAAHQHPTGDSDSTSSQSTAGQAAAAGQHAAEHGHHGGGHSHAVSPNADRRYLWTAFGLIVAFMAAEVVVGFSVGSLVLLADAGHMVSDAAAIGLALFAMRLARRPAAGAYTYGLKRAEILSALVNGGALLALGALFVVEAVRRLLDPPDVAGVPVLVVALVGVLVNIAATLAMRRADRRSLNIEGSFQHILTDLYAFIGTAVAGVVILTTGFVQADAIATLLVAVLMIKAGVGLVRESGRVVLEAAPRGTDPASVRMAIMAMPGVLDVHELHVWEVTSGFPALSAHVLVDGHQDCHERRAELEHVLAQRFDIEHTTLQVDHPQATGDNHRHRDDPGCPTAC